MQFEDRPAVLGIGGGGGSAVLGCDPFDDGQPEAGARP